MKDEVLGFLINRRTSTKRWLMYSRIHGGEIEHIEDELETIERLIITRVIDLQKEEEAQ